MNLRIQDDPTQYQVFSLDYYPARYARAYVVGNTSSPVVWSGHLDKNGCTPALDLQNDTYYALGLDLLIGAPYNDDSRWPISGPRFHVVDSPGESSASGVSVFGFRTKAIRHPASAPPVIVKLDSWAHGETSGTRVGAVISEALYREWDNFPVASVSLFGRQEYVVRADTDTDVNPCPRNTLTVDVL
jgi:hypothetical protein